MIYKGFDKGEGRRDFQKLGGKSAGNLRNRPVEDPVSQRRRWQTGGQFRRRSGNASERGKIHGTRFGKNRFTGSSFGYVREIHVFLRQ